MKFIDRLQRVASLYRSLTGLTLRRFDRFLEKVAAARANRQSQQHSRSARRRQPGGARKPKLDPAESLLLT